MYEWIGIFSPLWTLESAEKDQGIGWVAVDLPNVLQTNRFPAEFCNTCDRSFQTCMSWDHLISSIALRIRQSLDLDPLLQTTVDEVHQLLGCDRVFIYRFDPDWSGRVVVEATSDPQWSILDRVTHDPCFQSSWIAPYQAKHYFAVEDIATANLTPCHAEVLTSLEVKANLVIPILAGETGDTLWGLLIAHHCQATRSWQAVEIEGLQLIADEVGIAIHQASLVEQLQAAKSNLEAQVAARTRELEQANTQLAQVNEKLIEKVRDRLRVEAERTRLTNALEASLNEIYLFNADTLLFEYVNQGALQNLGYTLSQMQQITPVDIKPNLSVADFEALVAPLRQGATTKLNFETVHQRADGSCYPVDVHLQLTQQGDRSVFLGVVLDISDRKQLETERRQEQAQLRRLATIVESSQDAIISKNPDGIITSWNRAAETLFGYTAAEIIGQPITTIIPADHQAEAQQISDRIHQGQQVDTYETQRLSKDGQLIDVAITISPICDPDGHVIGTSKIARDIRIRKRSERRQQEVEQALRDNQERFQSFMENAPFLSWVVCHNGRVEYANRAWLDFIGQTEASALGKSLVEILPPNLAAVCQKNNEQVIQSGQVLETLEETVTAAGESRSFLVRKFPVFQADQMTSVGGLAIDMTEQNRAAALVQEQAETLNIFYESSPLMMGVVEISSDDILHVSDNPATLSFFGQTEAALKDKWDSELRVPPEITTLWLTHYRQSQTELRPIQFDYCHRAEGHEFWLLVTVAFVGVGSSDRPRFSYIVQDLTSIKQLESEKADAFSRLQDSEHRYANLVAAVPVGIFRTNATGQCVYVNEQWRRLAGMTWEESLGDGWAQAIYPDDREQVFTALAKVAEAQQRFELEYRFQSTTGAVAWVYGQAVAEYATTGEFLGYIGTVTDITDRKQVEFERQQALQIRSELSLLEQLIDMVLAGYWDWDIAQNQEYLSPGFKRMVGYADDELPNSPETWKQLIFAEDLPKALACLDRHVQSHGQEPYYNEVRYRHKDGSAVWSICSGQVIEWGDDGQAIRIIGCHIDISDRKQAELELKSAKDQLELVLQASSEGFWDWDLLTNEIYFSPRWKEMLGYADHELDNSFAMWESVILEGDRLAAQQLIEAYNSGQVDKFAAIQRFHHKAGSTVHVLSRAIHLKNDQGQVIRMVGSHLDVTSTIYIQEALQSSEMQLSSILNSALDGIMAFRSIRDDQGKIIDFEWLVSNPTACQSINQQLEDLIGQRLLEILPGNRTDGLFDLYVEVVEKGAPIQRQFHYSHDGINAWFENIAVKLGDGFTVTFRDISDIKVSEQALQTANKTLERHLQDLRQRNTEMLLLSETSDFLQACRTIEEACSVITTLVEPLFPDCSGSFYITCASRNQLETVAQWGENLHSAAEFYPHDCWALRRGRWHQITPERSGLRCNHIAHTHQHLSTLCIPMIAQGDTLGMFHLSTEKTDALNEAKRQLACTVAEQVGLAIANLNLRETLQHQSIRDSLTGLFNRRYLEEALEKEIARAHRHQSSVAVVMLDVDHFKSFNDTYGHDAGDCVLKAIAQALKDNIRAADTACRYGGEEMTLIFSENSLGEALTLAEHLRHIISQLNVTYGNQRLNGLTASFGVAVFPEHGTIGAALIQAADGALYRAKAAGRNQVIAAGNNPREATL